YLRRMPIVSWSEIETIEMPWEELQSGEHAVLPGQPGQKVTVQRARNPRVTEYFRLISRTMIDPASERTLQSTITPIGSGHIDLAFSITTRNLSHLISLAGAFHSVILDFFIKTTGKNHFRNDVASLLPLIRFDSAAALEVRALSLNCLTTHY